MNTISLTFTSCTTLAFPVNLQCMSLDCWRKLNHLEETGPSTNIGPSSSNVRGQCYQEGHYNYYQSRVIKIPNSDKCHCGVKKRKVCKSASQWEECTVITAVLVWGAMLLSVITWRWRWGVFWRERLQGAAQVQICFTLLPNKSSHYRSSFSLLFFTRYIFHNILSDTTVTLK